MKDERQSRQRVEPSAKTAARCPAASNSRSLIGLLLAAGVVLGCSDKPPTASQAAFLRAEEHHDAYELEEAIAAYTEAIELDPTLAEAYHRRGVARMSSAVYDDATVIEDQTKAIALRPDYPEAYYERAAAHLSMAVKQDGQVVKEDLERAVGDLTRAMELEPTNAKYCWFLGICHQVAGDAETAKRYHKKAMEIDPNLWGGFPVP